MRRKQIDVEVERMVGGGGLGVLVSMASLGVALALKRGGSTDLTSVGSIDPVSPEIEALIRELHGIAVKELACFTPLEPHEALAGLIEQSALVAAELSRALRDLRLDGTEAERLDPQIQSLKTMIARIEALVLLAKGGRR